MSIGLWDRWRPSLEHVAPSGTLPLRQQDNDDDGKVTKAHHAWYTKNNSLGELSAANRKPPCVAAPIKFVYLLRMSRRQKSTFSPEAVNEFRLNQSTAYHEPQKGQSRSWFVCQCILNAIKNILNSVNVCHAVARLNELGCTTLISPLSLFLNKNNNKTKQKNKT